ncbi:hypothetical protein D3C81_2336380 [compost metagenome]
MRVHLYMILIVIDEEESGIAICADRIPQRMRIIRGNALCPLRKHGCHRRQPPSEPAEKIMQRPQ